MNKNDVITLITFVFFFCLITGCNLYDQTEDQFTCDDSLEPVAVNRNQGDRHLSMLPVGMEEKYVQIPSISLSIDELYWTQLNENPQDDLSVPALLDVPQRASIRVHVELQGYSSRRAPKKNWKVKLPVSMDLNLFDRHLSTRKLIFKGTWKDPSMMREALAWRALKFTGHPTPELSWVLLSINGKEYGLYQVVEPIDEDYLARRGYSRGGALYKGVNQSATFEEGIDLSRGFEPKGSNYPPDWRDLRKLQHAIQQLNANPSLEEIYTLIHPQIPIDWLIERVAWLAITQSTDAITQNFYVYNMHTVESPKWLWIDWDSDLSFSAHWKVSVLSKPWDVSPLLNGRKGLNKKLLSNPAMRRMLALYLREMIDGPWSPDSMVSWVTEFESRIGEWIDYDLELWGRGYTRAEVLESIYLFSHNRPSFLITILDLFTSDEFIP